MQAKRHLVNRILPHDSVGVHAAKVEIVGEKAKLDALAHSNPVAEIQRDLRAIGYFVGHDVDGQYAQGTWRSCYPNATSGKRQRQANGMVDRSTAEMIKAVRP